MENKAKRLNRDAKIKLLQVLQAGALTESDQKELRQLLGVNPITLEIIDRREQVNNEYNNKT